MWQKQDFQGQFQLQTEVFRPPKEAARSKEALEGVSVLRHASTVEDSQRESREKDALIARLIAEIAPGDLNMVFFTTPELLEIEPRATVQGELARALVKLLHDGCQVALPQVTLAA